MTALASPLRRASRSCVHGTQALGIMTGAKNPKQRGAKRGRDESSPRTCIEDSAAGVQRARERLLASLDAVGAMPPGIVVSDWKPPQSGAPAPPAAST